MKFQIFKNGQGVEQFKVCGGYLFGNDGQCIRRSKVTFENGFIDCQKPNSDSAGLALLWPGDGFGRILLPTTCLPERERPYSLNVELARARLMQTMNRREEWSVLHSSDELEEVSKQAQELFVKAVQKIREPAVASQLADAALKKAMIFSEKLAVYQADAAFKARHKTRGFHRSCLGCTVDVDRMADPVYVERLIQLAPFAVVPMDWAKLEPKPGFFDFSTVDRCIEILHGQRMIVGAGPLLRFVPRHLPAWLLEGGDRDFEKIREMAYRFITEVVTRYSRRVHRWFVVSGLNASNPFAFNVEQVLEMTRAATLAVKAVNSRAFKIVEVTDVWGEYYGTVPNTISPVGYMDMIVQGGIGFDAFALQIRLGKDEDGMHVRDMMQISTLLDYLSVLGKPLYLTGVEIPSQVGTGPFDGAVAGVWHREWDSIRQALWLDQFYTVGLSKPAVDGIVYGNLADRDDSVIASSGLLNGKLEPKDAYRVLKKYRDVVAAK